MGCDIHAHTEIKVNGRWEHYAAPRIQRDYTLFSLIAGVRRHRDDERIITLPRGLPLDASTTTRIESEHIDTDGHSHSWLNLEEMVFVESKFRGGLFGYFFGNDIDATKDGWPVEVEDARVVFWFDN